VPERLHSALRAGGFLFLESSKPADAKSDLVATIGKKHRMEKSVEARRLAPDAPGAGGLTCAKLPARPSNCRAARHTRLFECPQPVFQAAGCKL